MTDRTKRKALIFLLLTVLGTIVLAAAVTQLELAPGVPLPKPPEETIGQETGQTRSISISINTYLIAILESFLVLSLAFGVYKLIKKAPWKEILRPALFVGAAAVVVVGILFSLTRVHIDFQPQVPETLPPAVDVPEPVMKPLPTGLTWLVWVGLAAGIVFLAIWLSRRRANRMPSGDALELEALRAMQDLQAGSDLQNVIVRCYTQMSRLLQIEQGLERQGSMTAREFESLLEARGVPRDPVKQLTGLFEAARYGFRPPRAADEQIAFDSLSAIVQYSRARLVRDQDES
jgi:Domain of unknown function (DUF4129)